MKLSCKSIILVCILSLFAISCISGKSAKHAKRGAFLPLKKVVAVGEFKTENIAYGPDVVKNLGDMLVDKLVGTGKFIVVERDRDANDLTLSRAAEREQAAKQSGKTIGGGAEAGVAMAAQALFVGMVTGIGKGSSVGGVGAGPIGGGFGAGGMGTTSDEVNMIVRWYDTSSLAIKGSHECSKFRSTLGLAGFGMEGGIFGAGGAVLRNTMHKTFSRAMDRCVRWVVKEMEPLPWEGRIVKASGDIAYINAGSDAGVREGDVFDVFTKGELLTDPVTGATLGLEETPSGRIKVSDVKPTYSSALIVTGEGFERGDIIHPAMTETE